MDAASNVQSTRSGANHHMSSLPPTSLAHVNAAQRLMANQQSYVGSKSNVNSLPQPGNYRNQYEGLSNSYNNVERYSGKNSSGPVINTHNRHGLIEVNNRRPNAATNW